jgi:uncharacterized phiE125 gp8 family phage protein
MTLKLITAPTVEPVTLAEAKIQCRVDTDITTDDALLTGLIAAAREACEHELGRALLEQVWERTLDVFPCDGGGIALGMPPVSAIGSITYLDADGAEQVMDQSAHSLDSASDSEAFALPAAGTDWPTTGDYLNAVRVRFTCGFGPDAADVPQAIRAWILLKVAALYVGGEGADAATKMAPHLDRLLDRWRVYGG